MVNERIMELLENAISILIDEDISNADIKDGIGATETEWEEIMERF